MKLNYELDPQVMDAFMQHIKTDENMLYSIPFDLSPTGLYCDGWLLVTSCSLYTFYDGSMTSKIDIAEGTDYKSVALVGNGYLEVTINNSPKIIVRYTMTHVPKYAYISKALNNIKELGTSNIKSVDDGGTCIKCGRVLPEQTKICPACINKVEVLKKLWHVSKRHKNIFIITMLMFWLITLLRLIVPRLYRELIDVYLIPQQSVITPVLLLVGAIGICALFESLFTILRGRMMADAGSRLSHDLREMVYQKIQVLSLSYLDQRKTGDLMNRVTGDTNHIRHFIQFQAGMGINEILVLIGVSIILFTRSWQMALLILLPTPLALILCRIVWKKIRLLYRAQGREWDNAESLLQDILNGIRVVKAFGQEQYTINKFKRSSKNLANITQRNEKAWNTLLPSLSFIMKAGSFFVLIYGGSLVIGQQLAFGELIEFSQYAGLIYGPLQFISFFPRMFADAINATERIFEVMEEEPSVKDNNTPVKHSLDGNISFDHVVFGYKSHEPVLEDISIDINKGEMVGLVGHSGAGKSTFINLVMRFYDADGGNIYIDGMDIRDISQSDLRSQIGVVLQETFLFSGTVLDNIRYSKPNATMDEIIMAAKIANAHDFIIQFSDAYDTKVGEKGHRLSGGERQRIAIARAILCDPKILILDEATASLDTETEQQIQEALGRLIKNRTTLAIAHRLSTLKNADRLMVIEAGKMIESGSHEDLMHKKGIYYKMVMAQREMSQLRGIEG